MRGSKRRAKPSRGRRRHSPTARTPIVARDCSARSGQRVTTSGSGARRAARASGRRSATSSPARANHSETSAAGVSARRGSSPRDCRRWRTSSHKRRAPPNNCKLPRTSSSTASGGSRFTRGVKSSAAVAVASSIARSRPGSRDTTCRPGCSASAELSAMPRTTPAAAACASQSQTTFAPRSRSTTTTGAEVSGCSDSST